MSERPVVLITGVSGGIGYATAEVFHRAGWFVIGADKREVEDKLGVVGRFFQIDIADPHQIDALVESIVTNESRLDALVNNAAIQVCKSFIETTLEEWDLVMNVNLRSMFWLSRQAYSLLKATKGSIVNVSSVHAVATSKNIAAYAASKGAVVAMTRAMAIEFSSSEIRVNVVLPGAVKTDMLLSGLGRGHFKDQEQSNQLKVLASNHPLGRVGEPIEIAKTILFLIDSEQSSFITGQTFVVDGGATLRLSTE